MGILQKIFGARQKTIPDKQEASKLSMRYEALLGIIVWIQAPGDVKTEEHPAALEFFCTHNPQTTAVFKRHSKEVQIGIAKIDKPKDEFRKSAVDAAGMQAKDLTPCVLVVQQGAMQSDDLSTNQAYLVCSFFRGPGPNNSVVIPQPGTEIVLESD